MTIGTNDSFPPAGPAFGPALGPALGPTPSLAPMFDVSLVSGAIFGHVTSMVINLYIMFYYKKAVMAEDLTSSKLYMKKTIWIGEIPFSNIIRT